MSHHDRITLDIYDEHGEWVNEEDVYVEIECSIDPGEAPSSDCPGSGPVVYINECTRLDTGETIDLDSVLADDARERLERRIIDGEEERQKGEAACAKHEQMVMDPYF